MIGWPTLPGISPQKSAYQDFVERTRGAFSWVAFIDTDEFIALKRDRSIKRFLALDRFIGASAIVMSWRLFGSNGQLHRDFDFVIRRFTRCGPAGAIFLVKSLVRPEAVIRAHVHLFEMEGRIVDERGVDIVRKPKGRVDNPQMRRLQLNHYYTKSVAEFDAKRMRGSANAPLGRQFILRSVAAFDHHDQNDFEDTTALERLPKMEHVYRRLARRVPRNVLPYKIVK